MTATDWAEFTEADAMRDRLLEAALPHIAFDGWSRAALDAGAREAGIEPQEARRAFPRGGIDMALAFHARADAQLKDELLEGVFEGEKIRAQVAGALKRRLEIIAPEKEAVRRAATLFALPTNAPLGAKAIWATVDAVWTGLGDESRDGNWYSKRAILSGVWSATLLYWLGDASEDFTETRAFIDRRIEGVMRFEKTKAQINANPLGRLLMAGPNLAMSMARAPGEGATGWRPFRKPMPDDPPA